MLEEQHIIKMLQDFVNEEILYADENDAINADSELLASGAVDSMAATQLMMFAEETYEVEFDPNDLTFDNFNTLGALATLIMMRKSATV